MIATGIIFWFSVIGSAYLGQKATRQSLHWRELMVLWTCAFTVAFCSTWMFLETAR